MPMKKLALIVPKNFIKCGVTVQYFSLGIGFHNNVV